MIFKFAELRISCIYIFSNQKNYNFKFQSKFQAIMFNKSSKILIKGVKAGQIRYFSSFQAPKPEQNPMNAEAKQQNLGNLLKFKILKFFFILKSIKSLTSKTNLSWMFLRTQKSLVSKKESTKVFFKIIFLTLNIFLKS